ncbi:MarR family winged helix-turn-helix transcriptional regulator [Thalassobaculum sp.]|uniref:MarR family winged helix-turn-helix transcriptional regulator n=1 Tax=Thalassobaculum sp. TaxID=2022740 RepID=UPI0032EED804
MHMLFANKLGTLATLLGDRTREALDGMSPSAGAILLTLRYHGENTASALSAIAGIAQPTAVRVIDGLVRRGLIERDARVGKTAPLRLTPAGERTADNLQKTRLMALQTVLDGLTNDQQADLERLIDTLLARATTSCAFARTTCRLCDHALCAGSACPIGTRATEIEREEAAC